jgi:hypothetical protein
VGCFASMQPSGRSVSSFNKFMTARLVSFNDIVESHDDIGTDLVLHLY